MKDERVSTSRVERDEGGASPSVRRNGGWWNCRQMESKDKQEVLSSSECCATGGPF